MTQQEFMNSGAWAPFSLEDIAEFAVDIEDNEDLQYAAAQFLDWKSKFESELEKIEFEFR